MHERTIRNIQPDRRDRRRRGERYIAAQTRESEDEAEGAGEPDWIPGQIADVHANWQQEIPVRIGDLHFLSTWANHLPPGMPPEGMTLSGVEYMYGCLRLTITRERIHHPRIRGNGEGTAAMSVQTSEMQGL